MLSAPRSILAAGLFMTAASPAFAAEGVSPSAYTLTHFFGLPITNAMVTGWVISLCVILFIRLLVGKPTLVPSSGQAFVETVVGGIRGVVTPVVGAKMVKHVFWLLIGLFSFILFHNWSGLIPGVGAYGLYDAEGSLKYWQRPANADMNMTLGLAIVVQCAWLFYVLKYAGLKVLLFDWFGNKADKKSMPLIIYFLLSPIFFVVGCIEVISWGFRTVSLSFRLFGNVFGGESLLAGMSNIMAWLIPVPFYFLELLIGFVQALVFTLLTAVYIGLICNHGDGDHH